MGDEAMDSAGGFGLGPPHKRPRGEDGSFLGGERWGITEFLERKDEKVPPNHILLITIRDAKYPVNVEVIYKVCSIVGPVVRVVCFERNTVTQAMVEFDTLENASKARSSLHGADIYSNCCTMKVEYSKMETLTCRENGPMSWDFSSNLPPRGERRTILNEQELCGGGAQPPRTVQL